MTVVAIIDDEQCGLWYHKEDKIVRHRIWTFLAPGRFEELLSKGTDCMERFGAKKWLSDDSDNPVINPQSLEWALRAWTPRVLRAGFKYWAIVPPGGAVGRRQMEGFLGDYRKLGIIVELFDDAASALEWLQSVDR